MPFMSFPTAFYGILSVLSYQLLFLSQRPVNLGVIVCVLMCAALSRSMCVDVHDQLRCEFIWFDVCASFQLGSMDWHACDDLKTFQSDPITTASAVAAACTARSQPAQLLPQHMCTRAHMAWCGGAA